MSNADTNHVEFGRLKRVFTRNPFVTDYNRTWCEEHGEDYNQLNAEDDAHEDEEI